MTDFKLDMTMMLATHDALRRDLERVSTLEARNAGWNVFEQMLRMHHTAEDDLLWPVMRDEVRCQPDDLALLDAMEEEHAAIEPILETLDEGACPRQARFRIEARARNASPRPLEP